MKNKDHQSRNFRVQHFLASRTYVRRVEKRDGAKDRVGETFHWHNPTQYRKFVTHGNNCSDVTLVYICKDHHCFPITDEKLKHMTSNGLISLTRLLHHLWINICVFTYLKEQEGILHVHACIRWTTIAWAHQIWWRQIGNSRKVSVLLKAISSVLWIPTFLQKMFSMTKIGRFLRGFSVVDFSVVGFRDLLKTLKTQRQKSLFLYKSDFHWQRCISSCI